MHTFKQIANESLDTAVLKPSLSDIPRETYTQMSASDFVLILFNFLMKF